MKFSLKNFILTVLAHSAYLSGLALIIPLSIIIVFSKFVVAGSVLKLLTTAVLLICAGAAMMYFATRSESRTLRSLGITTLIPALLSVLLMFVNQQLVFATISFYVRDFQKVEPFIQRYLEQRVPHSLFLTVGYLIVGIILIYLSKRK